ncbi:unnamed protein product, partial [Owenia fusiformis]
GAGKSFGELALISKDCIRNASIIATGETVDLLVVHRTLYNRCLKQAQLQEFQEKTEFVNKSPLFSNWQPKHRKHMAMSLEKQNYEYEAHINKQGDSVVGIHFINKGQARLYTDASLHPAQFPNLNPFEDNNTRNIQKHISRKNNSTGVDTSKESVDDEKQVGCGVTVIQRRREGYVAAEQRVHNRQTELCYIGPQEAIDDTEVAMDLTTYAHSACCTQDTEVFFLNLKNYERLVVKRNNRTVQLLKDSIETKLKCRLSRLADFQIPLLRYLYFKLKSRDMLMTLKNEVEDNHMTKFDPPRGPMVDQFGPGSVFHRIRMRDKRRRYRDAINKGLAPKFAGVNLAKKQIMDSHQDGLNHHLEPNTNSNLNGSKQDVTKLESGAYLSKSTPERMTEYDLRRIFDDEQAKVVNAHQSDTALVSLEERIKRWLLHADGKEPKTVPKLKRFHLQETSPKLRPGARVLFDKSGTQQATIYATLSDDDEAYQPKQPKDLKRIALANKYKSLSDGHLSSDSDSAATKSPVHHRRIQLTPGQTSIKRKDRHTTINGNITLK